MFLHLLWRNEGVHGQASNIKSKIINGVSLLHPRNTMPRSEIISKPRYRNASLARVGDEHPLDGSIVLDFRAHAGLPVGGARAGGLDSGEEGVF